MTDSFATAVYLYGVTRGLDLATLDGTVGVAGAPVRGITAGGLTALVSTVQTAEYGEDALRANLEDLAWLEATARAHHEVVDRAARAAPTAPVRIATVYRDDDRVSQILGQEAERFGAVIDRIIGRSEWGVKAYLYPEKDRTAGASGTEEAAASVTGSAASGGAPEGAAGGTSAGTGTAYLRRRQEQRRRQADAGRQVAERVQAIESELRSHAVAERRHPPQDPRLSGHAGTLILNMAYLLDDEHAADFLALVRDLDGRRPEIGVEVTGPWPPYSFIEVEETLAGEKR